MKVVHRLLLVAVACWLRQGGASTAAGDCPHACGGVSVPYPFGLKDGCASSLEFLLSCSTTEGRGEQLLLGNIRVRKISPEDSTMLVSLPVVPDCYDGNGRLLNQSGDLVIDLSDKRPQYTLSDTRNSLTVLGCDTYALMSFNDGTFRSGCISYCNNSDELAKDTTCSGLGCCQVSIPKGLKKLRIRVESFDGHMSVRQFNPCGMAFVGDKRSFNKSDWTLSGTQDFGKKVDAVLDWMFGWNDVPSEQPPSQSQSQSQPPSQSSNQSSFDCGRNAYRSYYEDRAGYRCLCTDGYEGNPYDRIRGCQEIDEFKKPRKSRCRKKCHNHPGNCKCEDNRRAIALAAVLAPVLIIGVGASASSTWKWRIRRINFRRNGGEHFKSAGVKIFEEAELAKATGNFDETKKLGEGSFGSVYRGKLEGDPLPDVVIKKPKDVHKPLVKKDFKNELTKLMQISRKHVVKLRGICLETRIPLLVYDYIPNGTLFQQIHENESTILKSWKSRLKVAAEAAFALKYMHSRKIIHGNIKSRNILLDKNWSAKVSDFGTLALISPEHSHIATGGIGGTSGYMDPEYLINGELTMKSDVYSFGVVLVELLTGKKPTSPVSNSGEPITESEELISPITDSGEPISSVTESGELIDPVTTSEEEIDIISYFVSSEKDKTLDKIVPGVIDFKASSDDEMEEVKKVAAIAVKCLHQSGGKRPTMKRVAQDLTKIDPSLKDEENDEVTMTTRISLKSSVSFGASEQGTSSCLSCMGMDSACPSCF